MNNKTDLANKNHIAIPISGAEELAEFRKSLLGILSEFEIVNCNSELIECIKKTYNLLDYLKEENLER